MEHYRAKIQYDEASLREMDAALQNTFYIWKKLIYFGFSATLMALGINLGMTTTLGLICVLIACLFAPYAFGRDMPSYMARQNIKLMRNRYIDMDYGFLADRFICKVDGNETTYQYSDIHYLIKTDTALYLCLTKVQGCMLKKGSLNPGNVEDFMEFISKKTGCVWQQPKSIVRLTLGRIFPRRSRDPMEQLRKKLR